MNFSGKLSSKNSISSPKSKVSEIYSENMRISMENSSVSSPYSERKNTASMFNQPQRSSQSNRAKEGRRTVLRLLSTHQKGTNLEKSLRNVSSFHKKGLNNKEESMNIDDDVQNLSAEELLDLAISILQKPLNKRSTRDIKMLVKCTENIYFFQEFIKINEHNTHEQCCRYMTPKYQLSGTTVFEEGSLGTTFYIILRGSVGVYIRENIINQKNNENIIHFKRVKILPKGASFGELALMEKRPRAATIICEEDCNFAVLEKKYFNHILREKEQKKFYEQIEFFASMKIFDNWSYAAIKQIYLTVFQGDFLKNQIVYKENDKSENLYVIKDGEFTMFKLITIKIPIKDIKTQLKYFSNELQATNTKKLNTRSHFFKISIMGVGESFGEEELLNNENRLTTVICTSIKGSLYILNKNEFFKRVISDENAQNILMTQIRNKSEFRSNRIKEFLEIWKISISNNQDLNNINIVNDDENKEFLIQKQNILPLNLFKGNKKERITASEILLKPETIVKIVQNNEKIKKMNPNFIKKKVAMAKLIGEKEIYYENERKLNNLNLYKRKKINIIWEKDKNKEKIIHKNQQTKHYRSKTLIGIKMPIDSENIKERDHYKNNEVENHKIMKNTFYNKINKTGEKFKKIFQSDLQFIINNKLNKKIENKIDFSNINDSLLPLKYQSLKIKENNRESTNFFFRTQKSLSFKKSF